MGQVLGVQGGAGRCSFAGERGDGEVGLCARSAPVLRGSSQVVCSQQEDFGGLVVAGERCLSCAIPRALPCGGLISESLGAVNLHPVPRTWPLDRVRLSSPLLSPLWLV